jgi:hypothetical protein
VKYAEGETRFDLEDDQPLTGMTPKGVAESFPMDGARSLYGTTKLASEMFLPEYKGKKIKKKNKKKTQKSDFEFRISGCFVRDQSVWRLGWTGSVWKD